MLAKYHLSMQCLIEIGGKNGIRLFAAVALSGNLLGMILTAGNGGQVYSQGYRLMTLGAEGEQHTADYHAFR